MLKKLLIIIGNVFFSPLLLLAQPDKYTGTWQAMGMLNGDSSSAYTITLQIADGEKKQLYPALLTITFKEFSAAYELLLVRKNNGELALGRNKIPVEEKPFSAGSWTVYLNGTLALNKNPDGQPYFSINRIAAKKYGVTMPGIMTFSEGQRSTALQVRELLKDENFTLQKINNEAWKSPSVDKILNPSISSFYYGLIDTFHVNTDFGNLSLADNKKSDEDSVSVTVNGKALFDYVDLSHFRPDDDIRLDTGMNLIVFFADNFGKTPPNTGRLSLTFGDVRRSLDFTDKADISATFIFAKIYYYPDETQKPANPEFPGSIRITASPSGQKQITDRALQRNTRLLDSLKITSAEITLALWDDAVEDGDTISLSLNEQWVVQGFPVKKKPQFLTVTLQPGNNDIIFVADNLGLIPPNTSILEIIDGKYRKAYDISTNYGLNNMIKIQYDYKGP